MVFTVTTFTTDLRIVHLFKKKRWCTLVEKVFVGRSLGLGKNEYSYRDIFYAWFLAPKKVWRGY